jgi:hypothetical protein
MKTPLKWLSISFILFAFIFTFGFAYYDYKDSTLDNVAFLTQDTYQVYSNDLALSTVFTDIDLSTSLTFIPAISVRGPPA